MLLSFFCLNHLANAPPSKNTESLIRNLGKGNTADFNGCRECSICLGSVLVRFSPAPLLQTHCTNKTATLPMSVYGRLRPRMALQMCQSLDPHS